MSDAAEALSAEQIAANEARARAESESLRFLQNNISYAGDATDNKKLADHLQANGWDWTAENLSRAYAEIGDGLHHRTSDEVAARAKALTAQLSSPKPTEFPWGILSKESINQMEPKTMRRFLKDKQFVEQLNAVLRRK